MNLGDCARRCTTVVLKRRHLRVRRQRPIFNRLQRVGEKIYKDGGSKTMVAGNQRSTFGSARLPRTAAVAYTTKRLRGDQLNLLPQLQ